MEGGTGLSHPLKESTSPVTAIRRNQNQKPPANLLAQLFGCLPRPNHGGLPILVLGFALPVPPSRGQARPLPKLRPRRYAHFQRLCPHWGNEFQCMREMLFIKLALSCLVEGNRIHPKFPISTLPLRRTKRQPPSRFRLRSSQPLWGSTAARFVVPVIAGASLSRCFTLHTLLTRSILRGPDFTALALSSRSVFDTPSASREKAARSTALECRFCTYSVTASSKRPPACSVHLASGERPYRVVAGDTRKMCCQQ